MTKNLYFITESFPPLGRGGSIIRAHFAKVLSENGWNVQVITQGKRNGFFLKWEYDHKYSAHFKDLKIHYINPSRWGIVGEVLSTLKLVPSLYMSWVRRVIKQLPDIVKTKDGIIWASHTDIACFYVALAMKKRFNFPLCLDFRDDYFDIDISQFVKRADLFFTTTETIKKKLIDQYQLNPQRVTVIYNGYDQRIDNLKEREPSEPMKIVYAGTISNYVKAERLNLAYQKLLNDHPDLKGKIEIDVYGQKGYYYYLKYRKTLVEGINFKGFIGHDELMNRLSREADIGYFSLSDERYSYATPTKLFEYINLEIPILAALPDGEAKNLIQKHAIGKVAQYSDVDDLAQKIYEYYTNPEDRREKRENIRRIKNNFDIRKQANNMSDTLIAQYWN